MNCPICRKEVTRENPEFPFCGERCRIIDLGNWASGKYVISTSVSQPSRPQKANQDEHED